MTSHEEKGKNVEEGEIAIVKDEKAIVSKFDYLPYTSNYLYVDENNQVRVMSETDKKLSFVRSVVGNKIVITLEDGTTGTAKRDPIDEFAIKTGTEIAYFRALVRYYNKFVKKLIRNTYKK